MAVFIFGVLAAFLALITAFLRLLARAEELSKPRTGFSDGAVRGEQLQDWAAWTGLIATTIAVIGAAFIPNAEVPRETVGMWAGILSLAWIVGMVSILVLFRKYGWPYRPVTASPDALSPAAPEGAGSSSPR